MTIASIDPSLGQVDGLTAVSPRPGVTPVVDTDGDNGRSSGARLSVSPLAQVLSQLQQLQQTNPAKFTSVLTDIANKLHAAAQQEGGPQGQRLADLADRFQQAAQTGDLSALRPAHRHHHHHSHGAAAYKKSSDQVVPQSQPSDILNEVLKQDLGTTKIAAS